MSTQGGFDLGSAPDVRAIEDEGVWVHIRGLDEELMYFKRSEEADPEPVEVLVAGTYSHRYRKAVQAQNTRTLKKGRNLQVTGELLDANKLEVTIRCVMDWRGFRSGEREVPCSPENVRAVLIADPSIQDQLESAMGDHEAFFKKGSQS